MNLHSNRADPLEEAILRTVLYADIFDFPLTAPEIHRFLVGYACDRETVQAALEGGRLGEWIESEPPYYFLAGKAYSASVRQHYLPEVGRRWARAAVYARLLRSVPYVRGAFVTGSLAAGNVDGHSDVDFLLIARPGRLLLCHAWIKLVIRRLLGGAGRVVAGDYFDWMCPNFIVAEDQMGLPARDLYTAWEATQAVPIFGHDVCHRFLHANAWIQEHLPNGLRKPRQPPGPAQSGLGARTEPLDGEGSVLIARHEQRAPGLLGRAVETALPCPVAGAMEQGLRAWLGRKHATQCQGERTVAPGGPLPVTRPPHERPDAALRNTERSAARWQMFPATTRYRILAAYQYRLRCFGLDPDPRLDLEPAVAQV